MADSRVFSLIIPPCSISGNTSSFSGKGIKPSKLITSVECLHDDFWNPISINKCNNYPIWGNITYYLFNII